MKNENKQTAIDFLIKQKQKWGMIILDDLQQAKQMEKQQIKNAFINGYLDSYNAQNNINADEIFYQQTYGGNK
jgi:hypothetical protein